MKNAKMTAQALTITLGASLAILITAIGGGFYLSQKQLQSFAQETSRLDAEAGMKQQNISDLQKLKVDLEKLAPLQEKAKKISADSKSYQYQNEIVADITKIAAASGVSITSYTFSDTGAASPAAGATAPTATPSPAPAVAPGTPAAPNSAPTATASQLKSKTVTVNFQSPLKYASLLNFVHLIEQNPTKMQIATLNISRGEKPDEVTTQSFQIEVYVK